MELFLHSSRWFRDSHKNRFTVTYEQDRDFVCRSVDTGGWLMKGKAAGVATLTIHPYPMSNLRTDGAIPLLPPYVLMVRCLFKDSNKFVSSVGIATCYRLDGPGIESRWGRDFPHPSRPALGPTRSPIQWVPALFPGVKRPGRGVDHPPHLAPRLMKE